MSDAQTPTPAAAPVEHHGDRIVIVQQPAPEKKRGILRRILGYFVVAVVVMSFLLNFMLLQWLGVLAGAGAGPREKYIQGDARSTHKVAVVTIAGVISDDGGSPMSGHGMLADVLAQLQKAREDDKVFAVLLEVDSPGGTVTGSDFILHEIERVKAAGKRVVVWMGGTAASGGYYVSARADRIYASPTTITGSIGVVWPLFNVEGLTQKIGVKFVPITRGSLKEMGSPFREMKPEERKRFETLAQDAYEGFKRIVREGRDLSVEEIDRIADGGILTAQEALDRKLIDKIGYFEEALADARAQHPDAAVVRYHMPGGLLSALLSNRAQPNPREVRVVLDAPLLRLAPGLHYVWLPGVPLND